MKHLDLFSGIGGFALATEMVWPQVEHIFCDNEPFSQAILKKHWPQATIYGDIRTLTADAESKRMERRDIEYGTAIVNEKNIVDLLTGGFPCQPFSQAGRRLGTEDDRHLWPEMLRVIREFHPRWVIGENVGGFVTWSGGLVLEQVHADLEGEGYEVQAFIVPAVAKNAPHRRDRVWIVAHQSGEQMGLAGQPRQGAAGAPQDARSIGRRGRRDGDTGGSGRPLQTQGSDTALHEDAGNTTRQRLEKPKQSQQQKRLQNAQRGASDAPYSESSGSSKSGETRREASEGSACRRGLADNDSWRENWLEAATRLCSLDDGLPNGLARPRGWRNAALKGAGNAIVPRVAAEIFTAIQAVEESAVTPQLPLIAA